MMSRQPLVQLSVGLAVELTCICLLTWHGNFLEAGEGARFTVLAILAGAASWLAVRGFLHAAPPRSSALWFWTVAVVLRIAVLPILPGDDIWRCRWEGVIQLRGFNPYQLAPDAPVLAGLRDADWSRINHQNVPAIYPPLTELTFAALARGGVPVWGYKLLFLLADLGVAALLRRLLVRRGVSPDAAAWYAWNPLAVYVSAGAAHFDALMVVAMLGGISCLDRLPEPPDARTGKPTWRVPMLAWVSVLLLGIAIAFKAVPAVLLPVWFFALGWRRALITLPVALGLAPLLALLYGFPGVPVFATLGRFARDFRVNDALWWLVDPAGRAVGIYGPVTALVCLALAVWLRRDWRRATLWVLGAALLLSPVLHAWYALWLLPLAVWRGEGARAWLVFSVSVFGYFLLWEVNHDSGLPWTEPLWLRLLIYLPPLVTLGWPVFVPRSPPADPAKTWYE